ncbi:hypothetical protein [Gracilibacillus oryzae]|uniref:hypothetical protein n=1 Tax=Gracilibacillus oryzae TaxID=1672701 RepID=UPI00224AA783|nr:hypothetical protein [Gracilibacillus oryzae]
MKDRFRRAAADEQNHAVWFMYFSLNGTENRIVSCQLENYGTKGVLNAAILTPAQMLIYALQDEYSHKQGR